MIERYARQLIEAVPRVPRVPRVPGAEARSIALVVALREGGRILGYRLVKGNWQVEMRTWVNGEPRPRTFKLPEGVI